MEKIDRKLLYFKNKSTFEALQKNQQISDDSIVFIESSQQIYTHGQFWDGASYKEVIKDIQDKIASLESGSGSKLENGTLLGYVDGNEFRFGQTVQSKTYTAGEGVSIVDRKISNKIATADSIGGIKLLPDGWSDNLQKKYRVQLDNYNRAFVQVPWESNGGSSSDGKNGGTWELIFCSSETQPATPANGSSDISYPWSHSAPNSGVIWMTSRFITGDGVYDNWQTPWRISGPTGMPGEDGEGIEFVYIGTASAQLSSDLVENLNAQWPNGSLGTKKFQDDDFVPKDWSDDPSGIDSSRKYEWAAVRYSNKADSDYKWTRFQGPFLWSKWGENGMDGDNVEYIYWAGPRNGSPQNPVNWASDADFQTTEYIRSGSGWLDNPIDLRESVYGPGSIQLVSIRKKHNNIWGAYSEPVLWTSYPYDGTTGNDGIVADLDNDMMAVALKENGRNYAFSQQARIYLYAGVGEVTDGRRDTIKAVYRTDSSNTEVTAATYEHYLSINASTHTLTVNMQEDAVDFSDGGLTVIIESTGNINSMSVTRTCALYINGLRFGTDGASYKLTTSHQVIRRNKNLQISPESIECKCVKISGTDDMTEWTANQLESYTTSNNGHFEIWTRVDSTDSTKLTTSTVSTTGVADKLTIYLYFIDSTSRQWLVDQETIFVVSDGMDGVAGQNAITYQIHPLSSSVKKGTSQRIVNGVSTPYDAIWGEVFFYITRTEGTTITKLQNSDLVTYDLSITASIGTTSVPVSYLNGNTPWDEDNPWKCKAWAPNPLVWSDDKAFTQIKLECGGVIIASAIIPASIPGKDGNDAVQSLKYQITRTRVWTSPPDPAYNDGTVTESDGITYADIVYYGQDVYLCVKAGTTETPGNSNDWLKFKQEGNAVFNYLLTNYIHTTGLTAKQIVVTDDNDKPVAGMLSGSAIPAEITTNITGFGTQNDTNNSVRLFAGLPGVGGNITDTAWNVRENGDMYVGKNGSTRSNQFLADGSGFVANGNISWDVNGNVNIKNSKIDTDSEIDVPGGEQYNSHQYMILIHSMTYGHDQTLNGNTDTSIYVKFSIVKNGFFIKSGTLSFDYALPTTLNNSIMAYAVINELKKNDNFGVYFGNNSSSYIFKNGDDVYISILNNWIVNPKTIFPDPSDSTVAISVAQLTWFVYSSNVSWLNI